MSEQISTALKRGDAQQALELAKTMVEQAPEKADSHYWLALSYQSLGDASSALAAIEKAIALAPQQNDYAMLRSVMLLGDKDLSAAQAGLMDTLALNPNQLEAYIGLIHIALAQKNLAEARRLMLLVERVDADDQNVLVAKGSIAQASGDIDLALKCFTKASETNSNNVLALSGLGTAYLQKKMPVFAEQALKRASELAPKNTGILRALVQSQLDQNLLTEAEQSVSAIILLGSAEAADLHLRSQLRSALQNIDGALEDARAVFSLRPNDSQVLAAVCTLLIQANKIEEAKQLLDDELVKQPYSDALWQLRCGFEFAVNGDGKKIIDAWLTQLPESALANEALAVNLESTGHLAEATVAVDKALSLSENLALAQFVKLRQEVREMPEQALLRAHQLAKSANNPESQRMILSWLGVIHDKLGQFELAADAFSEMAKFVLPLKTLPTPSPSVDLSAEPDILGRLLWAPVGSRIERVFNALSPILGSNLLVDRNQPTPARDDGFGPIRANPGSPDAGNALNWKTGILALGLQPKDVLDWIPHWDAYTANALQGTELLAVIIDPRDALLNWMVFGSAQSYVFPPNIKQAAKWLSASYHAIADTVANGPQKVQLVKIDDMDSRANEISANLQAALGSELAPDIVQLEKPIFALGGMANQFPAGQWRNYQAYFADAFALLTPAAIRLGYSES